MLNTLEKIILGYLDEALKVEEERRWMGQRDKTVKEEAGKSQIELLEYEGRELGTKEYSCF